MKINKIKLIFCLLPLLTSCNGGTRIYKGVELVYNYNARVYYPQTSLGVHINSTCKDFYVEYLQIVYDEIRNEWGVSMK